MYAAGHRAANTRLARRPAFVAVQHHNQLSKGIEQLRLPV
jgi:hypothetical protein